MNKSMRSVLKSGRDFARPSEYILAKNKALPTAFDGVSDINPVTHSTDVRFNWNWMPREWVEEQSREGGIGYEINKFIEEISIDSNRELDPIQRDNLYALAGACMVPTSRLNKIVILQGDGADGKSVYLNLIKLCLSSNLWSSADVLGRADNRFRFEGLDRGIVNINDDQAVINAYSFSALKEIVTGTGGITIDQKYGKTVTLKTSPQFVIATNSIARSFDDSRGMKRRLFTMRFHLSLTDDQIDFDKLAHLVGTEGDWVRRNMEIAQGTYKAEGMQIGNILYEYEPYVMNSLDNGPLCWFANKARYMYLDYVAEGRVRFKETEEMREAAEEVVSEGYGSLLNTFWGWYVDTVVKGVLEENETCEGFVPDLYAKYTEFCEHENIAPMVLAVFLRHIKQVIQRNQNVDVKISKRRNDYNVLKNYYVIKGVGGE